MTYTEMTADTQATVSELDLVPKPIRDYLIGTLKFSKTRCVNVYTALGTRTIDLIQENPYSIMRARSVAFVMADKFAQGAPFFVADNDPRRLAAAVESGFSEIEEGEGHCYTSRGDVVKKAVNTSKVAAGLINSWLDKMIADHTIVSDTFHGVEILGLPYTWQAEVDLARWMNEAVGLHLKPVDLNPDLDEDQIDAVTSALKAPVTVVTGGPGHGKTHVINEITRQYKLAGVTFALMAPTGRAASRMTELTGYAASTIHKYVLQKRFPKKDEYGDTVQFVDPDVIVVDESSMLTLHLLHTLLKDFDGQLVLVGDPDQLPAIGAGQVLHDVIAADTDNHVNVIELRTNHRSANVLGIAAAADTVLSGTIPPQGQGFAWVENVPDSVFSTMAVYKHYGDALRGAPALAYTNAEVNALNVELRELYNPTGDTYVLKVAKDVERLFRVGDPVMNTKNNYDLMIMNGETGTVLSVDAKHDTVTCEFAGEKILFNKTTLRELVPAYAFTVHKAQGMEYPIVIVSVKSVSSWQKWVGRSWLYTAITRAKSGVILVGAPKSVANIAAVKDRGSRRTRLSEALSGTL